MTFYHMWQCCVSLAADLESQVKLEKKLALSSLSQTLPSSILTPLSYCLETVAFSQHSIFLDGKGAVPGGGLVGFLGAVLGNSLVRSDKAVSIFSMIRQFNINQTLHISSHQAAQGVPSLSMGLWK